MAEIQTQMETYIEKYVKQLQDQIAELKNENKMNIKMLQDQYQEMKKRLDEMNHEQTTQEIYYQKKLENMFIGAGHKTLKTASGATIITDLTSPDEWNPLDHDGMPSFHIEIKNTSKYKEILTQLLMAQASLPRQLLIGVLFVNPPLKKLKDIFELFHPQGIRLAYFDHHDQLWWFDGKKGQHFKEIWTSKYCYENSTFNVVACIVAVWLILLPDTHTQKAMARIKSVDCVESTVKHSTDKQLRFECQSSIEFKTTDGKSVVGNVKQSSNFKPNVESEIEISYDPQNPTDISTLTIPLKSIGFIICCMTVLILSCILFERQMVKSPPVDLCIYLWSRNSSE